MASLISTSITGFSNGLNLCKHCLSSSKDKRISELKAMTTQRLNEYAEAHLSELDRVFERYTQVRLKNAFDINSQSDLNTFIRQSHVSDTTNSDMVTNNNAATSSYEAETNIR